MIQISLLNKYYNKGKKNEFHVINNTTLTLDDTGLVCILGESGSGKTTLMNTISGLDDFHDGTIRINETEIKKYNSKVQESIRNESFGYIFQNYYLLMDRTVEYNLSLALSLYHLSEKEEQDRIDYVLKAVDMERYKKRRVSQLSGGQQQRVAIARALAKTPKVVFADEPTGNLDEANTLKIMGILKKMSETCLVVLVTHERSIAEYFADRIIWIKDGTIEKDEYTEGSAGYKAIQDQNIYLKEYEKDASQNGNVLLEQYHKAEDAEKSKAALTLQIVYENGVYYVHAPEGEPVEFLSENKEKKVIDGYRPRFDNEDSAQLSEGYQIDPLSVKGTPKLSRSEIFRMAGQNLAALGKKQIFLAVSLLVMAVLVVLTLQDIMTMYRIDEKSVVTVDSHYIDVTITKNDMITDSKLRSGIIDFLAGIRGNVQDVTIYPAASAGATYCYEGFWQLEDVKSSLTAYSLVPLSLLDEEDLIYGRMPREDGEIVVDRWVLENFMKSNSIMSNVITNLETFLGGLCLVNQEYYYEIVGITDMDEPDIFVNDIEGLGWASRYQKNRLISIEQIRGQYPEEFGDFTLEDGQVLITKQTALSVAKAQYKDQFDVWEDIEYYQRRIEETKESLKSLEQIKQDVAEGKIDSEEVSENLELNIEWEKETIQSYEENIRFIMEQESIGEDGLCDGVSQADYDSIKEGVITLPIVFQYNNNSYEVAATLPDDYDDTGAVVINEESIEPFIDAIISSTYHFYIYTEDKESAMKAVEELLTDEVKASLNVKVNDAKAEQLRETVAARDLKVNARMILTVTIFVVSLIVLYFMMKASAVNRIGDLAVYRLLGISKKSIYLMFALEAAIFSCCTTLVGVAATTAVTKFLASIPSLGISIYYPWYIAILTFLVLFVIHIITGVLPIMRLLRLPPAKLASKYDI